MTINSPLSVIRSVIPSLEGVRILDIGCGAGELAVKSLAAEGAEVTGIDPNWEAVLNARGLIVTAH